MHFWWVDGMTGSETLAGEGGAEKRDVSQLTGFILPQSEMFCRRAHRLGVAPEAGIFLT